MINASHHKKVACVTGASGIIGKNIVDQLLSRGYEVKALTRKGDYQKRGIKIVHGSIDDEVILADYLDNASLLFHCAGELHDKSKMWEINVNGTRRLVRQIAKSRIEFCCYISSAGVVGKTDLSLVDEEAQCRPINVYEKSKYAAERIISQFDNQCRVVILRPTNVIDDEHPGPISLPIRGSLVDRMKVLLKGEECAHIIHAEDVAAACLYMATKAISGLQCYIVSCDEEPLNTYAGVWSLYKAYEKNKKIGTVQPVFRLPLIVPYLMRTLYRGKSNKGNVRYSSRKLAATGFVFPLGVIGAIKRIYSCRS